MTTPNKLFCIDVGHSVNFMGVRIHSPFRDFTVSLNEIKLIFHKKAGFSRITTLPYKNFITWDLYASSYPLLRFLMPVVKIYMGLLDRVKFLRSSFFSPHLILAIKK